MSQLTTQEPQVVKKNTIDDSVAFSANIITIITGIGSITGTILPLLSVGFFAMQTTTEGLEQINWVPNLWFQFLLLVSAGLSNYYWLRVKHWEKKRVKNKYQSTFWRFLIRDIPSKRIYLIIPPLFLVGLFLYVFPAFIIIPSILFLAGIPAWLSSGGAERRAKKMRAKQRVWNERIERLLELRGNVETVDFLSVGFHWHDYDKINAELKRYFDEFEFEKHLRLLPEEEKEIEGFGTAITRTLYIAVPNTKEALLIE